MTAPGRAAGGRMHIVRAPLHDHDAARAVERAAYVITRRAGAATAERQGRALAAAPFSATKFNDGNASAVIHRRLKSGDGARRSAIMCRPSRGSFPALPIATPSHPTNGQRRPIVDRARWLRHRSAGVNPWRQRTPSTRLSGGRRATRLALRLPAERGAFFFSGAAVGRARISLRSKLAGNPAEDRTDRFKGLALRHVEHDGASHVPLRGKIIPFRRENVRRA